MNDGLFEVTLIVNPKNPLELQEIITALVMAEDNTDLVHSFKTKKLLIEAEEEVPWTLDGEYGGTHEEVVIKNKNQALQIMVKEEAVEDLSEQLVEADEV